MLIIFKKTFMPFPGLLPSPPPKLQFLTKLYANGQKNPITHVYEINFGGAFINLFKCLFLNRCHWVKTRIFGY